MPEKNPYDHELSLFAAVAFLLAVAYAFVLFASWLRGSKKGSFKIQNATNILALILSVNIQSLTCSQNDGLADLIKGKNPILDEVLRLVPSITEGPKPPLLLRNRHIQFIPWMLQNEIHRLGGIPFETLDVNVTDCISKIDNCQLGGPNSEHMADTLTIDVFPPFGGESFFSSGFNQSSPIILFSPGLRCYSQDMPGNMIIRKAFQNGFRSVVMHRRGHTPDQKLKSPRWNLFGDVDDLEQVYWMIKDQLATPTTPMFLHGISSGTAVTVTALSKWDKRRREEPGRRTPAFVSSIDIAPGYDISKVLTRERFLFPYNDVLLVGVKDHFVKKNEEILRNLDSDAVDRALAAGSLQEFVDASVQFAGYRNVSEYYDDINPIKSFRDISTPKLVLNSMDDPCCNIQNLYERSRYAAHRGKTYAEMIRETQNAIVAVSWTGSHCPFLCSRDKLLPFVKDPFSGGWMLNSWADEVSMNYYLATLQLFNDRRLLT